MGDPPDSLMHILMIGGTGFIGPYVARELEQLGHEVTVYHRGQHESDLLPQVRHIRSERACIPVRELAADLRDIKPEIVIHMIAMGEDDSRAALNFFRGKVKRMVWLSSGDVYLAYGRFTGLEPGPVDNSLLTEDSPLRNVLYPYRSSAKTATELNYAYEKILVERIAMSDPGTPATILRLPKLYGPNINADMATVYAFRNHPNWRWTHGYVENVAAAIVTAALHPAAGRRVFNVGEEYTPTIAERLSDMPPSYLPIASTGYNFDQNMAYDTSRIRLELGYRERIPESEGLQRTLIRKSSLNT